MFQSRIVKMGELVVLPKRKGLGGQLCLAEMMVHGAVHERMASAQVMWFCLGKLEPCSEGR